MSRRRKPHPIDQNADKRRLRGLDLGAVYFVKRKPLSGKTTATLEWPHHIEREVAKAREILQSPQKYAEILSAPKAP